MVLESRCQRERPRPDAHQEQGPSSPREAKGSTTDQFIRVIRVIRGCEETWCLERIDGNFRKISRAVVAGLEQEFRFRREKYIYAGVKKGAPDRCYKPKKEN